MRPLCEGPTMPGEASKRDGIAGVDARAECLFRRAGPRRVDGCERETAAVVQAPLDDSDPEGRWCGRAGGAGCRRGRAGGGLPQQPRQEFPQDQQQHRCSRFNPPGSRHAARLVFRFSASKSGHCHPRSGERPRTRRGSSLAPCRAAASACQRGVGGEWTKLQTNQPLTAWR